MTQRKSSTGVMPDRDPSKDARTEHRSSGAVAPRLGRRRIWLLALVTAGVLLAGTFTFSSGSDLQQAGGSPPAQSNSANHTPDRYGALEAARRRAEPGAVDDSDRHLLNEAESAAVGTGEARDPRGVGGRP
jgi:hypothetical protein